MWPIVLLLGLLLPGCGGGGASLSQTPTGPISPTTNLSANPTTPPEEAARPRALLFQIFVGTTNVSVPIGGSSVLEYPGGISATLADAERMVAEIGTRIGTTGDAQHQLGFCLGPLALDQSDEQVRALIHGGFEIARRHHMVVAFHLDDSIFWSQHPDLQSTECIEWRDLSGTLNTGRRIDWGPQPTRVAPQLCFNSPAVERAVRQRAALIGQSIAAEDDRLLAGVMVGWETQIGQDFDTNSDLGYHALHNLGITLATQWDQSRVEVVHRFIQLWADSIQGQGIAREKIFAHIAFTPQGLVTPDPNQSYAQRCHFATPETAFGNSYSPGFSSYPEEGTFPAIYSVLAQHPPLGWASCEGTNVIPNGLPGEANMETYLGRVYNHGGVLVNLFGWGIGAPDNLFRQTAEADQAIVAYRKFLNHQPLQETESLRLQAKLARIQELLPGWLERTGGHAQVQPLLLQMDALLGAQRWAEANQLADQLLALLTLESG